MSMVRTTVTQLPFKPGTYITAPTTGDSILNIIGQEFTFPLEDLTSTLATAYGNYKGHYRTVRVVKNSISAAVLPSIAYSYAVTAGNYKRVLTAASASEAAEAYIADDMLPAAGAPDGSLLYVVVEGPCLVKNLGSNSARNLWSIGDDIVATAAGRAILVSYAGATAPLILQNENKLGRALSASTSDESSTLKLIYVGKF